MPAPAGPLAGVIPPGFAGRANLTIPLATLLHLADRPGEMTGIGPLDPDLARDLAAAAARTARSTWCVTVTDQDGHAIGHGCARPAPARSRANPPKRHKPGTAGGPGPPGGARHSPSPPRTSPARPAGTAPGEWPPAPPGSGTCSSPSSPSPRAGCDHRHEAKGHDPGVLLRHLTQIRHATCTGPGCRRPSTSADFEHNIPYEAGGRTCLCNGNPKCRHDHRAQAGPPLERRTAPHRPHPLDHTSRAAIPHRTHPVPDLISLRGTRSASKCPPHHSARLTATPGRTTARRRPGDQAPPSPRSGRPGRTPTSARCCWTVRPAAGPMPRSPRGTPPPR